MVPLLYHYCASLHCCSLFAFHKLKIMKPELFFVATKTTWITSHFTAALFISRPCQLTCLRTRLPSKKCFSLKVIAALYYQRRIHLHTMDSLCTSKATLKAARHLSNLLYPPLLTISCSFSDVAIKRFRFQHNIVFFKSIYVSQHLLFGPFFSFFLDASSFRQHLRQFFRFREKQYMEATCCNRQDTV